MHHAAARAAHALGGHLWAFKPFACDGGISFSPVVVTRTEVTAFPVSLTVAIPVKLRE